MGKVGNISSRIFMQTLLSNADTGTPQVTFSLRHLGTPAALPFKYQIYIRPPIPAAHHPKTPLFPGISREISPLNLFFSQAKGEKSFFVAHREEKMA